MSKEDGGKKQDQDAVVMATKNESYFCGNVVVVAGGGAGGPGGWGWSGEQEDVNFKGNQAPRFEWKLHLNRGKE